MLLGQNLEPGSVFGRGIYKCGKNLKSSIQIRLHKVANSFSGMSFPHLKSPYEN